MSEYYDPPPLEDMCSPTLLSALIDEAQKDERLAELLLAWEDPVKRDIMQEDGLDYIKQHIEFQAGTENTTYTAVVAPKGTGKNEVAMTLAFMTIPEFAKNGVQLYLKWARKPSEANKIFKQEVKKGRTVLMVLDEYETEFGPDSLREKKALIQLADTMREQRHCLEMCAITLAELGSLVKRCELVLRPIFVDRVNRINWCIVYVNSLDGKKLIPQYIVGLELHPYEEIRQAYKKHKSGKLQTLVEHGGLTGADGSRVAEITELVVKFMKKHNIEGSKPNIREILLVDIPGGRTLGGEEREATINRAFRELNPIEAKEEFDDKNVIVEWIGEEFDWKIKVHNYMVQTHKFRSEYEQVWYVKEIEGLKLYRDREQVKDLTGFTYETMIKWSKRMDKDTSFQGWLAYYRGEVLFEDWLAKRLEVLGWTVTRKPKVTINGEEYTEDLLIEADGEHVYINAKTGSTYRQYVKKEYQTAYLIATELKERAYIIYYDYATEVFKVVDAKLSAFNVGSKEIRSTKSLQRSKEYKAFQKSGIPPKFGDAHSTPLVLGLVVQGLVQVGGTGTGEGKVERGGEGEHGEVVGG